ncbi:hypothetical protein M426DRAFT_67935 [Hypoxylon sp. CI-4A]|nr:hypothetical protein M426DRAFT_67935 [Hypoxylon sp. CI-4A]
MASGGAIQQNARDLYDSEIPERTNPLLSLLTNSLVLHQTIPYLPISSLLNLAATSPSFRELLLCRTPGVFRHLDLTRVKTAQFAFEGAIDNGGEIWRNVQVDENLTEDDFYSGPLRGIFQSIRRRDILDHVQTLVLDGLSVTAEFCNDILVDPSLRVRILSIRDVKNLNERKLMQSLRYACRSTRPENTPRLKGLYVFGARDAPAESIRSGGDDWYHRRGRIITKHIADGWAETLLDCREVIKFDAVLCTGPRHQNSPAFGKVPVASGRTSSGAESRWGVATFALGGCASCGSAPEGFTVHGDSPVEELPLLAPVPLHSSTIKAATCPRPSQGCDATSETHKFVPRCLECIRERYCFSCDQWWCEACYQVPNRHDINIQHVHVISRSCWECEHNCLDCIANTQKLCRACGGGYCIIHYEGSTLTFVRLARSHKSLGFMLTVEIVRLYEIPT